VDLFHCCSLAQISYFITPLKIANICSPRQEFCVFRFKRAHRSTFRDNSSNTSRSMQLRNFVLSSIPAVADHVLDSCTPHTKDEHVGIYWPRFSETRALLVTFSGVASYGAPGHVPPRLPTISFLVHFAVNLTVTYSNIVSSARSAGADVNNSQLFRSVLH